MILQELLLLSGFLTRKRAKDTMSSLSTKSSKELLQLARKLVPPLSPKLHKGQAGRIVVFGGCEDYTGAPYFAAHAAAVFGADLSHIVCEKNAAPIIKTYSPNLMVHPYLYETASVPSSVTDTESFLLEKVMPKIHEMVKRIHVAVLGPGFGRDKLMLRTLELILSTLKDQKTPMILDADALYLLSQKPGLLDGYTDVIITPNVVEFKRIAEALGVDVKDDAIGETIAVSKKLKGVTIMRKGSEDIIVNGETVIKCDVKGSNRRTGGQGDTLTGTIATMVAWGKAYQSGLWDHGMDVQERDILALCCFGGSAVTRVASRRAFEDVGRAMQATDVHAKVGVAYSEVMESDNFEL